MVKVGSGKKSGVREKTNGAENVKENPISEESEDEKVFGAKYGFHELKMFQ